MDEETMKLLLNINAHYIEKMGAYDQIVKSLPFCRDIAALIVSFGYACDTCGTFSVGPARQCIWCFPNRVLCNECYELTGLTHMVCLQCGCCGFCSCDSHTHGWIVRLNDRFMKFIE